MADDANPSPPPAPSPSAPRHRRSGSETRRATDFITFRVLPADRAAAEARADAAGQTLGSYMRALLHAAPVTRARRRPAVHEVMLNRALAELNKMGSNVNQIARHMNMLNPVEAGEVSAARADIRLAVEAVLGALDRAPVREPQR